MIKISLIYCTPIQTLFIYKIKTDNFYCDIKMDLERFDTSDFLSDNVYNLPQVNKKVVGLMKDENNGKVITKYVGLRSKMYAYVLEGDHVVKKTRVLRRL